MTRYAVRYAGWALVGASGSLSFVAGFSFGIFLLPVFLIALTVMLTTRRSGDGQPPQGPGALLGMAAIALLILAINPAWWQLLPAALGLTALAIGLPLAGRRAPKSQTP